MSSRFTAAPIVERPANLVGEGLRRLAVVGGLHAAHHACRFEVEQRREIARTANVLARIPGATRPEEEVYVGAHHDAWCFGAADPLAGTICMLESARDFAELARQGVRLDRTLVFCAWGAEEYGIIGSSEFVERDADALAAHAVAYVNLDMAAMGLRPGAGVSPTLRGAVARALAKVPGPGEQASALDVWSKSASGAPSFGDLGGGSRAKGHADVSRSRATCRRPGPAPASPGDLV